MKPGTTQFDRIPISPHSLAVFFENASNAPFVDAYMLSPLYPVWSYTDFKVTDNIIIRNKGIVDSFTDFMHSGFTANNSINDRNEVASVISYIIKHM